MKKKKQPSNADDYKARIGFTQKKVVKKSLI